VGGVFATASGPHVPLPDVTGDVLNRPWEIDAGADERSIE